MEVKDYLKAGITSFGAMQLLEEAKLKAFYAGLSPKPDAMLVEYAKGYSDGVAMKREMEAVWCKVCERPVMEKVRMNDNVYKYYCAGCRTFISREDIDED
jgi:hypothetical protein